MASEVIKLNLIPTGTMPVFHASQFDTGRLITCELYRGEDAYSVPEGYTVELHCRKVDNNIVTMASTLINDNVVTFTSTEQLTACNGNNLCEVAILDDGYRIGTLNFILEVEIDPLKGGISSTSEIHNLETQIEEITTEVIGENYYNKTEVDVLLDSKADASSVYTKTQVDTALALKANAADVYTKSQTDTLLNAKADSDYVNTQLNILDDSIDVLADVVAGKANSSDVYTKAQVDSALALKANAADVYTKGQVDTALATKADKSDTYTKEQVDNIILDIMPVGTASGQIASFDTELAAPLVNVSCDITASGGNGTPDNPNPIVGYSSANITRCGVNLLHVNSRIDATQAQVHYTSDDNYIYLNGTKSGGGYADMSNLTMTLPRGTYYLKAFVISGTASNTVELYTYDGTNNLTGSLLAGEKTLTLTELTTFYFRFAVWADGTVLTDYKVGIVITTASGISAFIPYNGQNYAIAFGQTVYGGVLDVTRGKLKPCVEYPSYNGETLSGRWLSSEATYIEGTTPPTGSQVVSLDDYGSDIDLTPEVILAIVGTNNVYSDTNGDTTVQYKDSIQHYIDTHTGG